MSKIVLDVRSTRVTQTAPMVTVRTWLVTALVVVVLPTVSISSTDLGGDVLWLAALVICALLLILAIPASAQVLGDRPSTPAAWASWALAAAMLVSLALHQPATQAGMFWTIAALVGAGTACAVAVMAPSTVAAHVVGPLAGVAAAQGGLMVAQVITREPFGLAWLWPGAQLAVIDGVLRGQGTFFHVFEPALLGTVAMAGLALVATAKGRSVGWQLLAAGAAVPVALSYSRSALLAAFVVLASLVFAHRRQVDGALRLAVAMAIGLVVAGLIAAPGWLTRFDQSTSGDLDDVTLGRVTLARQAIEMIGDHPLIGVGTAKYIPTLETEYQPDPDHPFAVHNFALRVTAEVGIPLGLLVVALTIAAGVQAVRAGPVGAAVFLAMVPWMLFDVLYYDRVYGLLLLGVWWGLVAQATGRSQRSLAIRSS